MRSTLEPMVMIILQQLPFQLLFLVGLVLAFVRWQRHPRISLLVALACALGLIASGLSLAIHLFVMQNAGSGHAPMWLLSVLGGASLVLHVAMYALLITAAFMGRGAPAGSAEFPR